MPKSKKTKSGVKNKEDEVLLPPIIDTKDEIDPIIPEEKLPEDLLIEEELEDELDDLEEVWEE